MMLRSQVSIAALTLLGAAGASAHHSYAMFESARTATVTGVVAKLEWTNPHVFIWVYVPKEQDPSSYDLYAFENGPTNPLELNGWSKTTPKAGEHITITYAPLRDGRMGGHWIIGTCADGRVLKGAGGPARQNLPAPPAPSSP